MLFLQEALLYDNSTNYLLGSYFCLSEKLMGYSLKFQIKYFKKMPCVNFLSE